jgi:hypothetical protein
VSWTGSRETFLHQSDRSGTIQMLAAPSRLL